MTHRSTARARLSLLLAGAMVAGAIAIAAGQAAADTYTRQPGVKIAHYTFDVTLKRAYSRARPRENPDSAALLAPYAPAPASPSSATTDER